MPNPSLSSNVGRLMRTGGAILAVLALCAGSIANAESKVTDQASAIEVAKRYTRARCTAETPCTFKARREGSQWNVWVQFTKRFAPNEMPKPYPGGHVILYFNNEGSLVRRIEGE